MLRYAKKERKAAQSYSTSKATSTKASIAGAFYQGRGDNERTRVRENISQCRTWGFKTQEANTPNPKNNRPHIPPEAPMQHE